MSGTDGPGAGADRPMSEDGEPDDGWSDGGWPDDGWADDGWADDGWADAPGSGAGWSTDPRLRAGAEHVQRAAREVIAATRALLDVAEEVVEDPRAARDLLGLVAAAGDLLGRAARPPAPSTRPGRRDDRDVSADDDRPGDDPDDGPPVQRIPVS